MIGGFTLFGFDLFGISQQNAALHQGKRDEAVSEERSELDTKTEPEAEDEARPEPSEIFFWGMYPVY